MSIDITAERPELIYGKIWEINAPQDANTYTTANVSYTIRVRLPGATQVLDFRKQVPEIRLWPQDMELEPERLINKSVIGFKIGNKIRWHFYEPPKIRGCVEPPEPKPGAGPIVPDSVTIPTTPTTPGTPTAGPGDASSTPATGEA